MRLNRQILRLAIPNIISNLSVPLLSVADTALVGRLDQVYYIGAVAVGGMIFNFIYWGFGFLRMGTTGLTAQALGRKDDSETVLILGRAAAVALGCSSLIVILQWPIAEFSFYLVNASPEVEQYASSYFYIRIFAAPATLSLYAIQGWFLGMQNARYPLYLTVVTNLLNVGFNFLFILGFKMNSDGVALGTVCAQYIGLLLAAYLFNRSYGHLWPAFKKTEIFEVKAFKRFFVLNRDIFIRTLALIFTFSFFTAKSAEFGDSILAANTILIQLWMIFSYGIDGFAFASESLVGKFIGAKNILNLKKVIRYIFIWGTALGLFFSIAYFAFDQQLISIFTDKEEIISLAMTFMAWTIIAPLVNSFCYIWDGVYIGATASMPMRNAMLISAFIFFLPVYYFGRELWGNHGMWLALVLFMAVRGISLTLLARKYIFARLSTQQKSI